MASYFLLYAYCLYKKSFSEISYISYTRVPNVLCLQGISGEG